MRCAKLSLFSYIARDKPPKREFMKSDIVVIGAGASGLMAAYSAASELVASGSDASVTLLEKMPRPARKIMITGKGRCNFTNLKQWNDFNSHVRSGANFIKSSFYNLNPEALIRFFESYGMRRVVERGDRAYPASYHASDVVDTLVNACHSVGVKIECEAEVSSIREGYELELKDGRKWLCSKIIVATGGLSYPGTGSTGDGYAWARSLGHSTTPLFPSLTALVPRDYKLPSAPGGASFGSGASLEPGCSGASLGPGSAGAPADSVCGAPGAPVAAVPAVNVALDARVAAPAPTVNVAPAAAACAARVAAPAPTVNVAPAAAACAARTGASLRPGCDADPLHIDRSLPLSESGQKLCGVKLKNVGLSLLIEGTEADSDFGDLDFTDGGIEGPLGFRMSRKAVKAMVNGSRVALCLDLKPGVELTELTARVKSLWKEIDCDPRSKRLREKEKGRILLGKLMPWDLIPAFVDRNPGIYTLERRSRTDTKLWVNLVTIAKVLKCWRFDIAGYVGYERAVVTAGGVSTDELVAKTLESRLHQGLYFCGEVLDVDCDTGGYNLHSAFCTGALAGRSAALSLLREG